MLDLIGVRGEIDSFPDKTGSKSAERRPPESVARERQRREAPREGSGTLLRKFGEKMIAGSAFSKHFRRFLVTLKD